MTHTHSTLTTLDSHVGSQGVRGSGLRDRHRPHEQWDPTVGRVALGACVGTEAAGRRCLTPRMWRRWR
eukprot:COSAG02_NODE_193_length_29843_cov_30.519903_27_plen_68_part_00